MFTVQRRENGTEKAEHAWKTNGREEKVQDNVTTNLLQTNKLLVEARRGYTQGTLSTAARQNTDTHLHTLTHKHTLTHS